ncbi:ABC transporter ATP-binding protein [Psittacicella melopsittaci]|uniref:ABC transporter ATP-binding protein n=1 Tax=Psittacicella melopsittaci TaxID=2028576 RepID=A0A3A1Y3X8_9GAMM|nr:ABC transporter ATP-binding protein [Psittacicella melopsittaci]
MSKLLLDVQDLEVNFKTNDGVVTAVNKLNFQLHEGETLGIVGESGSGKSQASFSLIGLLASNGFTNGKAVYQSNFGEVDLLSLEDKQLNRIRGNEISMIFQDPMTSLNPYLTIGDQLAEVLVIHKGMSKNDALKEAKNILDAVKMPEAEKRLKMFPHEFSGGMRQRVVIAMSLLCKPKVIIADEPTTALDVTVQAQIMNLLRELQRDFKTSVILITHDLGVVAGFCEKVLVMYGGRTMEYGSTQDIFYDPTHPYTQGLLKSIPRIDKEDIKLSSIPGNPPNLLNLPTGCPFMPRCEHAIEACNGLAPLTGFGNDRRRACHIPAEEMTRRYHKLHKELTGEDYKQTHAHYFKDNVIVDHTGQALNNK